jgi:tetratricopeptide (TPR) repeat protein
MIGFSSKHIVGFVIVLLLIGAIFFRADVSRILSFGPSKPYEGNSGQVSSEAESNSQRIEEGTTFDGSQDDPVEYEDIPTTPISIQIPPYAGRDPSEIRPIPDEIKLFTEEQLQKIYSTIGTHASAVKEQPRFFNGWIQIGVLKKVIGDFQGARDAWEYAGVIEPLNSLSFANLGELYWRYLHEYERSEQSFRTAIKHKPEDPLIYISLSELYSYSYKEKENLADEVLFEGLSVIPDDVNLMKSLAYLYERQKKYVDSLEWWEKVLEREPNNVSVAETIKTLKEKLSQ